MHYGKQMLILHRIMRRRLEDGRHLGTWPWPSGSAA